MKVTVTFPKGCGKVTKNIQLKKVDKEAKLLKVI